MNTCPKCGNPIEETAPHCKICGKKIENKESTSKQQELLTRIGKFIHWERRLWYIFAILYILPTAGNIIIGFMFLSAGTITGEVRSATTLAISYFLTGIFGIVATVLMLKSASKATKCLNSLYTDCGLTVGRYSRVSLIVLGALFCPIAMIFIIINFTIIRNNEELLQKIWENQHN